MMTISPMMSAVPSTWRVSSAGQHQGTRALINLVGGTLVWEANIYTYPNASARAAHDEGMAALHLQVVPLAFADGGGAAVVGHF